MRCRFCSVNEERQQIIWRGTYVYAILSNPEMQVDLHLLVIPYRHIVHLSDLFPEERYEFIDVMAHFQRKMRESGPGLGCDLRQHDRPFLPESEEKVDHVHGHLILRSFNDTLYKEVQRFERFTRIPPEEMRRREERVKRLLALP